MTEELIIFFEQRPALNLSGIEKEADIPAGILSKFLRYERNLTRRQVNSLLAVLKNYGLEQNVT